MFWQKSKQVKDKNWVDDYAPTDRAEAEYFFGRPGAKRPAPESTHRKKNGWKLGAGMFAAAIILTGAGLAAIAVLDNRAAPSSKAPSTVSSGSSSGSDSGGAARQQRDFTASTGYLKLTYPSNWQIQETAGLITLRGPVHQIKTGSDTTKGRIELFISSKQTAAAPVVAGWDAGDAHAMAPSHAVAYAAPGPQQRPQTNLTYIRFPGNPEETADAAFLTGPTAYAMSQTIDKAALLASDPLVSVRAISCRSAADCTAMKPLRMTAADWQADTSAADVRAIIASFVFQ